jgi:tRNA pseudouridine38-40 synthase
MPVQRYACGVEYHGGHFAGWQIQASARSVEGVLQAAVEQVADHPVSLTVAGRTDAGVHATAQVVHFDSGAARSLRGWTFGINSALPADVSLSYVRPVPAHFHARYGAEARTYSYLIFNRRERSALAAGRACWHARPLDIVRMQQAASHLVGSHDFSAFRSSQCQ